MLLLSADDLRLALPMKDCVEAMKRAYAALSSGEAEVPLRSRLALPKQEGTAIFMPAYVDDPQQPALAIKIVSLFDRNPAQGLPLIHAAVLAIDPHNGQIAALLEGGSLTAIRTGAGCGAATDLLANPDAKTAAIIGAGVQARTQLQALCAVRPIETAWIYAPRREQVEAFIAEMAGQGDVPEDLRPAASAAEAVRQAEIISAATTSSSPVFADADLQDGAHINGAGSYTTEMQEIPTETVARAGVFVDSLGAVKAEAGDIVVPLSEGLLAESEITEIGALVNGNASGRQDNQQITFFKSVGVAVQDAVAGQLALRNARKLNLGTEVDW